MTTPSERHYWQYKIRSSVLAKPRTCYLICKTYTHDEAAGHCKKEHAGQFMEGSLLQFDPKKRKDEAERPDPIPIRLRAIQPATQPQSKMSTVFQKMTEKTVFFEKPDPETHKGFWALEKLNGEVLIYKDRPRDHRAIWALALAQFKKWNIVSLTPYIPLA